MSNTESPPIFQYTEPTLTVGNYVFDCGILNAYIRRVHSAYNKGVKYVMGALPDPAVDVIGAGTGFDCSGLCWWSTFRKRLGLMENNKYWIQTDVPVAGGCVRYDPKPGESYGHAGMIIQVYDDGNFDSFDSSSKAGTIKYRSKQGFSFWDKQPGVRFLVSSEALMSVNGVSYKAPLNLLLTVMKSPAKTITVAVGILVALSIVTIIGTKIYIDHINADK